MWRNINMSSYKDKCMKRRVAIRMRSTRCHDAAEYCNLLRQSPHELDLLQKALTIHVSQFFRNPSMFDTLRDVVLPGLFGASEKNGIGQLRLWCLGCACGEEPYSLALLLKEHFSKELRKVQTTIHGTDIDVETIRAAQQGEYFEERLKEVSADLRNRYFRPVGAHFRLVPEVRDMVTFLQGDITRTSEYVANDLVVCRNTLIYFTRHNQEKILHGIADILPAGGILVLGKSETLVGDVRQRFEAVCSVERIYRKLY
jgi:chemotaxis protein methyltransferase CheR